MIFWNHQSESGPDVNLEYGDLENWDLENWDLQFEISKTGS